MSDREAAARSAASAVALLGDDPRGAVAAVLGERGIEHFFVDDGADLGSVDAVAAIVRADTLGAAMAEAQALGEAAPELPLLIVCGEVKPGEMRLALGAGVAGVVTEGALAATLEPTLTAVRAGQICVPRREGPQVEPARLSTREKQILGLVVLGYMNSEIAEQLFVAVSTVKSHLSSAFGKLGVRSRNEAVDLIVDPERGLGMGILAIGGERIEAGGSGR